MGRGYALPNRLSGPGERRKLSSGVRGGNSAKKTILVLFTRVRTPLVTWTKSLKAESSALRDAD